MRGILGISLGTRLVGMAVVYDGELYDYRVRTFYGPWTPKKRRRIVGTIRRMMQRYEVAVLSLKAPKEAYCSHSIHGLLDDIQRLTSELNISLKRCTIGALKAHCNGPERSSKKRLMQAIAKSYVQHEKLTELLAKAQGNQSAYYTKLFEAIACTELA